VRALERRFVALTIALGYQRGLDQPGVYEQRHSPIEAMWASRESSPLFCWRRESLTLTFCVGGVYSRKIEFEFELDFLAVKVHSAKNAARKLN